LAASRPEGGTPLGIVVIGLLALAWAVVLVPTVARPRFESSPIDGVRNFEQAMGILASARTGRSHQPGRWVMVPKDLPNAPARRRSRIVARRRRTFERLLIAAGGTLLLGLLPWFHALLWIHLALDAGILGYVVQLRRWRMAEAERSRKVHSIAPVSDDTQPVPRVKESS
jgi:hypothetical protein